MKKEFQLKSKFSEFKSVLGIEQDNENDDFVFQFPGFVKLAQSLKITKRNILKLSASFYDPEKIASTITSRITKIFQLN